MRRRALAPAATATHPPADRVLPRLQLPNPAIDGAAGHARRRGGSRDATIAVRQRLIRGEQTPAPLVEERPGLRVAIPDVVNVDQPFRLASYGRVGPRESGFYSCVLSAIPIRLFLGGPLSD